MQLASAKLRRQLMRNSILMLPLILLTNNCASINNDIIEFEQKLKHISAKHITDNSLAVNDISLIEENGLVTITGKTTNREVHDHLSSFSDSLSFEYDVMLLPDPALGDSVHGIINVSVTPIREKTSHTSQMIDQAILGNSVKILYETGDWYLCQTHYDYVGWISRSAVYKCDDAFRTYWEQNAKYRLKDLNTMIHVEPNKLSMSVSDAVLNNRLVINDSLDQWFKVTLPDGRMGFIEKEKVELNNKNIKSRDHETLIISNALSMKGIPYLWGGNSSKGNDCSGFTQTVFKAAGIQLPRDARQQAKIGKSIKIENLKKGDLLFFGSGDRVTHVAISLGGPDFIHQGSKLEGKVDIHSLDPESPLYNDYRKGTFLFAKQMIE